MLPVAHRRQSARFCLRIRAPWRSTSFARFSFCDSQNHEERVIGKNCPDTYRISCSGMIKVRPMYRFFTNPSRYGRPRACARFNAATREVSGTGMTTSTVMFFSVSTRWTSFASALPIAIRLRYTLIPSRTESGRARYTYSNMSGAKVAAGTTWRLDTPERVSITASPDVFPHSQCDV